MTRLGLPVALVVVGAVSCGGKTSIGDEASRWDGAPRASSGGPGASLDPTIVKGGSGADVFGGPKSAPTSGVGVAPGGNSEPPIDADPPGGEIPTALDPTDRARERCEEMCALPEMQCQPPFSEDRETCLFACDQMATLGGSPSCAMTFVQLSYCLEDAAVAAGCGTDLVVLLPDFCPDLFPRYLGECAGAQAAPPLDPGFVECRAAEDFSESAACGSSRAVCSDGRSYEVNCYWAGSDFAECECLVDGRSSSGFGVGGAGLTLEELCFSPRGFESCGFPVVW